MRSRIGGFLAVLLTIGLAFPVQSSAQQQDSAFAWTPEQMIGLDAVSSPVISPDGKYVAYEVRTTLMEGEESEFRTQIWVAATDGSRNRQFTRGEASASSPSFSPDGKYLAFISKRGEKPQVYRMYLDGGEAEAVTHAGEGVGSYKWSPDGKSLAYTMTDPKSEEEQEREKEKRDVKVVDHEFRYSRIYVQSLEGDPLENKATQVTTGERNVTSYEWSPDGNRIAFAYWPTPKLDDRYKSDIAVVPSDSGAVTELVTWKGGDSNPHFSANGQTIYFSSSGGKMEPIGLANIYKVPVSGGKPEALAQTPDQQASIVELSADGSSLLVSEVYHTYTALYRLPVDGGQPVRLTPNDGVYGSYSLDDSGQKVAFIYQNTDMQPQVYVGAPDDFNRKQLSKVNADVEFPEMGKTELISWTSEDGRKIEGLLTYPVGYQKGEKYPLILNVHGGPGGAFMQSFTGRGSIYPIQYFAAQGYAVLRPNPRGSVGYGKEFRYANYRDWGYGDYEDLMSGVDKVLDMGVADPDSLVEMGWSYGGYMTSFIVTRTQRFKAVSMGAGLPDLISMVTTTDIPTYLMAHMGGYYWESDKLQDIYEKHSAVFHLRQIETPVQILHGAEDHRVPTSQGIEFYHALKWKGVDTELILYPRTPHGPREPKLIADVPHRILDWFNKYLNR